MVGGRKSNYFITCKTQISVSINKASLEGSHAHLLTCCLWEFNWVVATKTGLQNLTYLLSGPWQRIFPTLGFEAHGSRLHQAAASIHCPPGHSSMCVQIRMRPKAGRRSCEQQRLNEAQHYLHGLECCVEVNRMKFQVYMWSPRPCSVSERWSYRTGRGPHACWQRWEPGWVNGQTLQGNFIHTVKF